MDTRSRKGPVEKKELKKKPVNYRLNWTKFNQNNTHAYRKKEASVSKEAISGQIQTTINKELAHTNIAPNNAAVTLVYDPEPLQELDKSSDDYRVAMIYYNKLFPGYEINEDLRYFKAYAKKWNTFFPAIHPENAIFYFYSNNFDPRNPDYEPEFKDIFGNIYTYNNLPFVDGFFKLSPNDPSLEPYHNVSLKRDTLTDGCNYNIICVDYTENIQTSSEKQYKVKMGGLNKYTKRPYFYIQYPIEGILQNFYGEFFQRPPNSLEVNFSFGKNKSEINYLRSFL